MATEIIYPYGTKKITVPAGESIAVSCKNGTAVIFYSTFPVGSPESYYEQARLTNSATTYGPFSTESHVRIDAGVEKVYYSVATAPSVTEDVKITRSTVTSAATITAAQHQGLCLYQDASGGAVTMTTLTATELAAAFPDIAIGDSIPQYLSSNHATNTSTIAGGTGVTLVGSGAVINTGGTFLLIRTAAATFDLVRVG